MQSIPPNDKDNINIRSYVLDPLSVIIKLAILANKPVGTKILIQNNVIYFQEPGSFQSFCRIIYHANKGDIIYLNNPIQIACESFLSKEFIQTTPRIKTLFQSALKGIEKLIETYKACSVMTFTLHYFSLLILNYVNDSYNKLIFRKDNMSCLYNAEVNNAMNAKWSKEKIKIVLDIIGYLMSSDTASAESNVKSLETILENVDVPYT